MNIIKISTSWGKQYNFVHMVELPRTIALDPDVLDEYWNGRISDY